MKYKLSNKCCAKKIDINGESNIVNYVNDIHTDHHDVYEEANIGNEFRMNSNSNRNEINKTIRKNQLF